MNPPRILVVDDNVCLGENLVEILDGEGYKADYFERPREALRVLSAGRYDAALLDIRMPDMDGVELYRAIKAIDPALPAIAMTAWSGDERVRAALHEGVVAVFPKPVNAAILLSRLENVVSGELALVVEDDPDLSQNLCELLCASGWSVRCAPNCAEARLLAAQLPPVLLVVDWHLPDGDGIELAEEIGRTENPPFTMVFTGYAHESSLREVCAQHGKPTVLEKPGGLQRLLQLSADLRARRIAQRA